MFKRIAIALFTIVFIFSVTVPVCAESIDFKEGTQEVSPNWWPGNPNPQPGTEDWFFQHPNYGSNAPDPVAKECGYQAIVDSLLVPSGIAAFNTWYLKKKFDLYTFGLSFVAEVTYNYATCLWRSGVLE